MSTLYFLSLEMRDGSEVSVRRALRLRYRKDCYMMGTELTGEVIWQGDASQIKGIALRLGSRLVHKGYAAYVKAEVKSGRQIVSFESHGWSVMLGQNEPVPGMNFGVDLEALGALNTQIPNVTFEGGTDPVNYIFVKEHSTIWDALTAYGMKAYGRLPYIYGANEVRVRKPEGTERYISRADVVSEAVIADRRGIHSKVYMSDADGNYGISEENPLAADDGVVREKYYALDRQWLSAPETGLKMRLKLSQKRCRMTAVTKLGYDGEELFDSFRVSGQLDYRTVGGIEVVISNNRTLCTLYSMEEFEY